MTKALPPLVVFTACLAGCCDCPVRLSTAPQYRYGYGGDAGMTQIGITFQYGQLVQMNETVTASRDTILALADVVPAAGGTSLTDCTVVFGPNNGSNGIGRMVSQDFGASGTHTTWEVDAGAAILWGPFYYVRGRKFRAGGIASTGIVEVVDPVKARVYLIEAGTFTITNEAPASGSPASVSVPNGQYAELVYVMENGTEKLRIDGPFSIPASGAISDFVRSEQAKKEAIDGGP
jgi:hypothetical protein